MIPMSECTEATGHQYRMASGRKVCVFCNIPEPPPSEQSAKPAAPEDSWTKYALKCNGRVPMTMLALKETWLDGYKAGQADTVGELWKQLTELSCWVNLEYDDRHGWCAYRRKTWSEDDFVECGEERQNPHEALKALIEKLESIR